MRIRDAFYELFPRKCFICRASLDSDSTLCTACHDHVIPLDTYCPQCCEAILPDLGCVACSINPSNNVIDQYIIGYQYDGAVRDAIIQLKFNHRMYMVRVIKELMLSVINHHMDDLVKIDYIVPMPVDRVRLAGRGFNHMLEVALSLDKSIKRPIKHKILRKQAFTIPQSELSRQERLKNLRSSFECDQISGHVLLLDDVLTTGKTLEEAAKALKNAGAERITVLVIAKA